MPTELTIEISLDWTGKPVDNEFKALSKSAEALKHFLRQLDQVTPEIEQYYAIGRPSELTPLDYPIKQKITIYSYDQLLALTDILLGWVRLDMNKKIQISAREKTIRLNWETPRGQEDELFADLWR